MDDDRKNVFQVYKLIVISFWPRLGRDEETDKLQKVKCMQTTVGAFKSVVGECRGWNIPR